MLWERWQPRKVASVGDTMMMQWKVVGVWVHEDGQGVVESVQQQVNCRAEPPITAGRVREWSRRTRPWTI